MKLLLPATAAGWSPPTGAAVEGVVAGEPDGVGVAAGAGAVVGAGAGAPVPTVDADGTGTFGFQDPGTGVDGAKEVMCAPGDWQEPAEHVLTSAYGDGDAFVASLRWVDSPFAATLTCRVDGGTMTVDGKVNVSFGPTEFTMTSEEMSQS